jgi:hypothetical protein
VCTIQETRARYISRYMNRVMYINTLFPPQNYQIMEELPKVDTIPRGSSRFWKIWLTLSIIHFAISTAYKFSIPFQKALQRIVARIPFCDGLYFTEWFIFIGNIQLLIIIFYLILWLIMVILDGSGRMCHTCCCLCADCKSIDDDSDDPDIKSPMVDVKKDQ